MGAYGGPDVPTDGLVMHVDAANSKSYPGAGAEWFDLSGNEHHINLGANVAPSSVENTTVLHFPENSGGTGTNSSKSIY